MFMQVTLFAASAAGLIAVWLGYRCGQVRTKEKILHGDGGSGLLARRMRAQLNFVEYTPFALILVGALEIVGNGGLVLALTIAAFLVGRVLHAFGMDSETFSKKRMLGMIMTLLPMLGLVIAAVLAALGIV